MKLIEVLENQIAEYNNFVIKSETGSFLQVYEWGEWQKNLGKEVFRFWIKTENNDTVGTVQFLKIPLPFGKYYLYAPYGPVITTSENFQFSTSRQDFVGQAILNFQKCVKERFSEAVFIRIEPKNIEAKQSFFLNQGFKEQAGFKILKSPNIQPGKTLVIDLSKTKDQILGEMHSKTRYNIRLAEKHGVKVISDLVVTPGHGLYFQEVIDQIVETEKRQGYKGHGVNYYKKMVDFFALQYKGEISVFIYKAIKQNELLASGIMLDCGQTRTYLFGGSSEKNKNLMGPYLLHFKAMQEAQNKSLKMYDFWGVETSSGKTPGFARFKMGFGGKVLEYAGASDVPINNKSYWLYRVVRRLRF